MADGGWLADWHFACLARRRTTTETRPNAHPPACRNEVRRASPPVRVGSGLTSWGHERWRRLRHQRGVRVGHAEKADLLRLPGQRPVARRAIPFHGNAARPGRRGDVNRAARRAREANEDGHCKAPRERDGPIPYPSPLDGRLMPQTLFRYSPRATRRREFPAPQGDRRGKVKRNPATVSRDDGSDDANHLPMVPSGEKFQLLEVAIASHALGGYWPVDTFPLTFSASATRLASNPLHPLHRSLPHGPS